MELIRDIIYQIASAGVVWIGIKAIMEKSGFGFSGYMAVILGLIFVICGGLAFCVGIYFIIIEYILKK